MQIELLFFGIIEDIVGMRSKKMSLETSTTVEELNNHLQELFPALKRQANYAMAINMEYATNETVINNNDVVALIPPVSGG